MLFYERIDVSEGIDIIEMNDFSNGNIYHYIYFFRMNFSFQPNVCDGCQEF